MASPDRLLLAGRRQSFPPEFLDRLRHRESVVAGVLRGRLNKTLTREERNDLGRAGSRKPRRWRPGFPLQIRSDCFGRATREASVEDGQVAKEALLCGGQEVVVLGD